MKYELSGILKENPIYIDMIRNIDEHKTPMNITGLSSVHQAHFVASYFMDTQNKMLVITDTDANAIKVTNDINEIVGSEIAFPFQAREYMFRDMEGYSKEYEWARISALSNFTIFNSSIIVASIEGASQLTMPKEKLIKYSVEILEGKEYDLKEIAKKLVLSGYERHEQVTGFAEFSIRGGILDIFPPGYKEPVRIEFWGDEVDSINYFDPVTQRREDKLKKILITPATEVIPEDYKKLGEELKEVMNSVRGKQKAKVVEKNLADIEGLIEGERRNSLDRYLPFVYKNGETVLDYFEDGEVFFFLETANMKEVLSSANSLYEEEAKALYDEGVLFKGLEGFRKDFSYFIEKSKSHEAVHLDVFARTLADVSLKNLINASGVLTLSPWSGEYSILEDDLEEYFDKKYRVVLFAGTEKSAKNIKSELVKLGYSVVDHAKDLKPKTIFVKSGSISLGMDYQNDKLLFITHSHTSAVKKKRKKRKSGEVIRNVSDLTVGDYVVHISHGIGIFEGIFPIETDGLTKDYIKIKYAGTDMLYVSVTQLDLVSKYLGPKENTNIKLSKLNSSAWEKTKQRVRQSAKSMAKELTKLYAERMDTKGFAFSEDTEWQKEFEEKFEYEETEGQLRSIEEIKSDMEKQSPMDRLLCGDVGFGKTEVALRAVFKAVMDDKQAAMLAPTTILARQHYKTAVQRFDGFPIDVVLLSRELTQKQMKENLKAIKSGNANVVIGTHRILSKDVQFKDLGLAIIDEEQRFGVKHKEKFKEDKTNIDILTLSATPIPRTLNMAMTGIRDMSVIDEPPQDRRPVQTYVLEYDRALINEAIRRELRRNGQVYYLHNRVDDMPRVVKRLSEDLPEARIGMAHGQMTQEELSDVWEALVNQEIDVLVCTTIIETGVDIANCNTLIIENADNLGLSQLYQIRGRVGRSARRAYAYFTFQKGKVMTEVATKRLTAIKELTNFGSGFQIAMRDLEIRGAGSILGGNQHGHMESVGYDLYVQILGEALAEVRGEEVKPKAEECLIDIKIDAFIPDSYIVGTSQRIEGYKLIASIQSVEDSYEVMDELIDRYGEPPSSVVGLIEVALIRNQASALRILEISEAVDGKIIFYLDEINMDEIGYVIKNMQGRVLINASGKPYISVAKRKGESNIDVTKDVLSLMIESRKESTNTEK